MWKRINIEETIVEKANYYEDDDYRDEIAGASKIFNEENSEKKEMRKMDNMIRILRILRMKKN